MLLTDKLSEFLKISREKGQTYALKSFHGWLGGQKRSENDS